VSKAIDPYRLLGSTEKYQYSKRPAGRLRTPRSRPLCRTGACAPARRRSRRCSSSPSPPACPSCRAEDRRDRRLQQRAGHQPGQGPRGLRRGQQAAHPHRGNRRGAVVASAVRAGARDRPRAARRCRERRRSSPVGHRHCERSEATQCGARSPDVAFPWVASLRSQ